MHACAPAGPRFVCFLPNWLVFPCPAHQTACFSSHLASQPGLEPPARMRPAHGSQRRRGRLPTPWARPDQARAGRDDPSTPALLTPHPHASSLPTFKAHGLSPPYLVASLKACHVLGCQIPPPHTHLPLMISPQTSSTTASSQTGLKESSAEQGGLKFPL